jgi:superfamily II DNA/RNA helicase
VHRIGRTGRAGRSGTAVSLVHHAEQGALKRTERSCARRCRST